jgi:hypothetical protein
MPRIRPRIKFRKALILATAAFIIPVAVYSANEIPQKYRGKWKGI